MAKFGCRGTLLERFLAKVDKNGPVIRAGLTPCWSWKAATFDGIRGVVRIAKKNVIASRLSYQLHKAEIPAGICVLHICDNGNCVNPEHLWLGTNQDNTTDMLLKGRESKGDLHSIKVKLSCTPESNRRRARPGSLNGRANLTNTGVMEIRAYFSQNCRISDIAHFLAVPKSTINNIVKRHTWKHT